MGLSPDAIDELVATLAPIRSLNAPAPGLEDVEFEDLLRDETSPIPPLRSSAENAEPSSPGCSRRSHRESAR
jgi:hypothetical protein